MQDLEPGLKEVVMKVVLSAMEDHTALDSLLPLLDIPQVPYGNISPSRLIGTGVADPYNFPGSGFVYYLGLAKKIEGVIKFLNWNKT